MIENECMQSIADAEQSFGSARIASAYNPTLSYLRPIPSPPPPPSPTPFLSRPPSPTPTPTPSPYPNHPILTTYPTTATDRPIFLLELKYFIPYLPSPSRNSNPFILTSLLLPSPLAFLRVALLHRFLRMLYRFTSCKNC